MRKNQRLFRHNACTHRQIKVQKKFWNNPQVHIRLSWHRLATSVYLNSFVSWKEQNNPR